MKKILLFPFLLFTLSLLAQNASNLTISTTGKNNLKISFNNKKYSLQDRTVTFQALTPGIYPLTIYQLQNKAGGGTEYVNVFDRNITLTAQKHLEITVMRFGKTGWDENYIEKDEWNENYTNPKPVNDPGYSNNNNTWRIVNATQFAAIKKAMNDEYTEDDRLKMGKLVLKDNLFSAAQIRELSNTFYNDDKKLVFAKYAYDFCQDKGNYFTLGDIFYNSSYKRQLIEYISTR